MNDLPWRAYSAGVLPFTIVDERIYFLLGADRVEMVFSDFGGRAEADDLGNHRTTAAREFFEETAGMVMDFGSAHARLLDMHRPQCVIHSTTYGGMVYFMHVLDVPWTPEAVTAFHRVQSVLAKCTGADRYREKSALHWMPLETLRAEVHGTGARSELRSVFKHTLRGNWTRIDAYVNDMKKKSTPAHGDVQCTQPTGRGDHPTVAESAHRTAYW
jgi:hypothetical protein